MSCIGTTGINRCGTESGRATAGITLCQLRLPDAWAQATLPRAQHAAPATGGTLRSRNDSCGKQWDDDRMIQFPDRGEAMVRLFRKMSDDFFGNNLWKTMDRMIGLGWLRNVGTSAISDLFWQNQNPKWDYQVFWPGSRSSTLLASRCQRSRQSRVLPWSDEMKFLKETS